MIGGALSQEQISDYESQGFLVLRNVFTPEECDAYRQRMIDLETCKISDGMGFNEPFIVHSNPEVHAFRRDCLMKGLDDIGLTLQFEQEIASYEGLHPR